MRILIDLQGAQSTGSRNRGIGRYTLSLAQAIVRNRGEHEIVIALNGLFPDTIDPILALFEGILPEENVRVWSAPERVHYTDPANTWRRKSGELVYEAFLENQRPDILHVTSLFEGLVDDALTSIGRFSQTIPVATTLYDLIPLLNRNPYLENPIVESWYENKLDHIRRSSLLLAISESSRQEAIEWLGIPGTQVINIGTAADPQFRRTHISGQTKRMVRERYGLTKPFLMYTGGIDHRKNIDGLIRAYALLPREIRDTHQLAIVCSVQPDARETLIQLARHQGLGAEEVVLTNFVPEDDLICLYHLCKAFIFPSWHEGFGLPALEAMSCGAAVVAANTSSLPEVIGRDDALFDPRDDEAIALKIAHVLTDEAYRKDLIRHGTKQALRFSWDESARRTIAAFEGLVSSKSAESAFKSRITRRPRLAFVSPLPPERSGIADYSAELLPQLSRHYEIDVIVVQETISQPWINGNCRIRSADWLKENADFYDRILYHLGNSPYHQHMFGLLEKATGVVVLHDFFLGNIVSHIEWLGLDPNGWTRELYRSHGYVAVHERFHASEPGNIAWKYPCNRSFTEVAKGVIVHSRNSKVLAEKWLGAHFADDWSVVPLLRTPAVAPSCASARSRLGIRENDFVVCSFGLLGKAKLNHRLLDAWLSSSLGKDEHCLLIFVGENDAGDYGTSFASSIAASRLTQRIRITGWTDHSEYRDYLAAADVAVQLRTQSRGETSAAVLDCMNFGLPTIVNANGAMAELPTDAVWMLPDHFEDETLVHALETLRQDAERRRDLGQRGQHHIHAYHSPRNCSDQYRDAIEHSYLKSSTGKHGLIDSIARMGERPSADDLSTLASAIASNFPPIGIRQLFLDISILVQCDAKSGVQRVVRSILMELLLNPPTGYRVEPVYAKPDQPGGGFAYARQFTLRFLGCPDDTLIDEPIDAYQGDIFLAIDLAHFSALQENAFLGEIRSRGVKVYFIIYDLLPVLMPDVFPDNVPPLHSEWLATLAKADGVVCISRAVADEYKDWLSVFGPPRNRTLGLGWFHLGADVSSSQPTIGIPENAPELLTKLRSRPTFLTVGTIEPRKAPAQVLGAFEQLWAEDVDVNLVMVGKLGWKMDAFAERLRSHPEAASRLVWLQGISDEYLESIYAASTCLIAASLGEGFGLPLIEAAQHKLPVLARDIPVFREVAGNHAHYFSGSTEDALAEAVRQWLALDAIARAPQSEALPWLTWRQSTQQLLDVVLRNNWYERWMPDDVLRFWGNDSRLYSQIGRRQGREITTTGQAGCLIFGPYLSLPAGYYIVTVYGTTGPCGPGGALIDLVVDRGSVLLAETPVQATETGADNLLATMKIHLQVPASDLECRVQVSQESDLSVSALEIAPFQPSENNVPIPQQQEPANTVL